MLTTIVGYLATTTGTCLMLPQLYKTFKTKSVKDVSWGMLTVYFLNGILWFSYGVLIGSTPLIVSNSLGFIISIAQIILQVKYSKKSNTIETS